VPKWNSETETDLDARIIHDFMDVIIMKLLRERSLISGYEFVKLIHDRFHLCFSPGTVYSILYSLERKGFLEAVFKREVRVYKLTKQGEDNLSKICASGQHNKAIFASLFSDNEQEIVSTSSAPRVTV
jgi:DNA-binding PadR family transcriptional regulator